MKFNNHELTITWVFILNSYYLNDQKGKKKKNRLRQVVISNHLTVSSVNL